MTLIELLAMCVGKTQEERQALLVEVTDADLIQHIQATFNSDGRLVGDDPENVYYLFKA